MTEASLHRHRSGNNSPLPQVCSKIVHAAGSQLKFSPDKAVANFFTPLSKKEPEKMSWRIVKDSLLVGRYATSAARPAAKGKTKIAAFDFVRPLTGLPYDDILTDENVGLDASLDRIWQSIQS
jgi:hypothetical protein